MKFFIFISNIYLFMSMNTMAQDFSKHEWENRLILVYSENQNNSIYQKQLTEFIENEEGLLERKILVYHILPERYKIGLKSEDKWEKNTSLKILDVQFEVNLIGLDGGIKLSQKELLTAEKLFSIIDRMPMRRIEIENNE